MAEIVNCPQCDRKLRVPDELLGKKVKCPTCGTTFTAEVGEPTPPPPPAPRPEPRRSLGPPPGVGRRRDEDEEEYDEDDQREEPLSRPRRRRRRDLQPHRGPLILTLGILGLVVCIILAPFAWIMGNHDLAEMRSGRMDREGEGQTNAGRICGIIGTVLFGVVLGLNVCGCFVGIIMAILNPNH
jgi:predicted Zn finger-like uncharacterized protein